MGETVQQQSGLNAIKPYVPGRAIEEVQRQYGLADVIKLASNENPLGTSPKVIAALAEAAAEINLYPDPVAGALAAALGRHLNVPPEQVIVGNGADGIIRGLCVAYLNDGDEVIVSRSSFPVYDISTQVMRGTLVKTPLKNYGLDLAAMAAAITERTKIIFVCNPNNPTGTTVTAAEADALLAQVPSRVLVVFDEAYREFVDAADYPDSLHYVAEGRKNVIVLRSFSKVYGMAGLRLGYGIAQPELLAPLYASAESFPINRLAQAAGLAALADVDFLRKSVDMNRRGRETLYDGFARLGLAYVRSQGNFVLVEVGAQAGQVNELLLRQGVIVRPGRGYDLPEHLRITVGTPAQNARLLKALAIALETVRAAVPA